MMQISLTVLLAGNIVTILCRCVYVTLQGLVPRLPVSDCCDPLPLLLMNFSCTAAPVVAPVSRHIARVNAPPPLNVKKESDEWKLFKQMWTNYCIVVRLSNDEEKYKRALFSTYSWSGRIDCVQWNATRRKSHSG